MVICPNFIKGDKHALYTYVIQAERRDELMKYLNENGIETKIYHKPLVSDAPIFKQYVKEDIDSYHSSHQKWGLGTASLQQKYIESNLVDTK